MSADRAGLARRLGRLRGLAGVAAAGALGSLAGCATGPDGSTATAVTPASGPATTSPIRDPAACREALDEAEASLESIAAEGEALDAALPELRRRRDRLEAVASLFEPPDDAVVERAREVGEAARPAVAFLEFPNGLATGWYLDDHHLVTNAHNVIDPRSGEGREPTVWTLDGADREATVVGAESSFLPDVALLRTEAAAPATLTPGATPEAGEDVPLVQVGHPGGIGNWLVSLGGLQDVQTLRTETGRDVVELVSRIPGRQGVSGSPVLTLDGEVVGLTYAGTDVRVRPRGEPPTVAEPVVYDRPIAALTYGAHWAIDTVVASYEEWT